MRPGKVKVSPIYVKLFLFRINLYTSHNNISFPQTIEIMVFIFVLEWSLPLESITDIAGKWRVMTGVEEINISNLDKNLGQQSKETWMENPMAVGEDDLLVDWK